MARLLPCPFCGGKAITCEWSTRDEGHVYCERCDSGTDEFSTIEDAITMWNTRVGIPERDRPYQYGLFPLIREAIYGKRVITWIGTHRGWHDALFADSGTDIGE